LTPDELGDLRDTKMVLGKMQVYLRGEQIGNIKTRIDSPFHYGDAIPHVAQTIKLALLRTDYHGDLSMFKCIFFSTKNDI